jgi:histidinol-phosphate aminotransferase
VKLQYAIEGQGGTQWRLPEGIEKTEAAILLIVNPNAPSGHLDTVERLGKIAAGFRGLLVVDEAYVDFATTSALELVRQYANVLILRTMSKGYGLAGLRFGYGIAQPAVQKQLEKVRDSYPVDAVAIAAATAAIQDQTYARGTWERVKAERARLSAALRQLGFVMPESQSNFVLATAPAKCAARAIYEGLKARGILVRWWDLPRITDKVRITVGTPEQNDRLLGELAAILK